MTYAVYVRVSTDRDEQVSSVENQIDICRNWLERSGFTWDDEAVYKDEGITGTLLVQRPAIQLILQKAKKKEIEMIVFKSISRLARDLKDSLEIREVLTGHGVRIISIEEGYDSHKAGKNDMAFELWSLFSAQYSRTLSSGITAALAAKVRRGEHIGKVPYGYDRIEQKLVINESEAEVVRQIYQWYTFDKFGYKAITHKLNERGIPSKQKGKWQLTTIQRILKNPLYYGTFILNKYGSVKVAGRKKQVQNPPEKWLIFENHHPAIISKELFEQANDKENIRTRKKVSAWNEFRGLLKCGSCGANIVILQSGRKQRNGRRAWNYLKCSAYRRGGTHACVNHAPIQYDDFRSFIIERIIEKANHVALQLENESEQEREGQLSALRKKADALQAKKNDALDLYLDKIISKDEFEAKRTELEEEIQGLGEQITMLGQTATTDASVKDVREAFVQLNGSDLYSVFQTLIKAIVIYPDGTVDIHYEFERN
ncbi:recombinase family protein [Bacillus tianshenii]|nr:recombinase family protein [Bacillus tianshenii]